MAAPRKYRDGLRERAMRLVVEARRDPASAGGAIKRIASLYKAELVCDRGPWRGVDDLETATVEYIDWYSNRRLHGELGHHPTRRA